MIQKQLAIMEVAELAIVNASIEAYCRHNETMPPAEELAAAFEEVYDTARRMAVAAGIFGVRNSQPVADLEASKELVRTVTVPALPSPPARPVAC